MLCQRDNLRHYPNYISLRYLMKAVAAMFWHYEFVWFHILVDHWYYIIDLVSHPVYILEIHGT